jgi:hypothetical protein
MAWVLGGAEVTECWWVTHASPLLDKLQCQWPLWVREESFTDISWFRAMNDRCRDDYQALLGQNLTFAIPN